MNNQEWLSFPGLPAFSAELWKPCQNWIRRLKGKHNVVLFHC